MTNFADLLFKTAVCWWRSMARRVATVPGRLGAWPWLAITFFLATGLHAQEIRVGGTGGALGTMTLMAQSFSKQYPQTKLTVLPSLGSGGGIRALLSGAIDLALSSRALTPTEVKAGALGVEYARTPFVFATALNNPAVGLSTRELVDIYSGKTSHWPDGSRIRIILRPVGDSDNAMIKALSPEMQVANERSEQRAGMAFAVSDQDAADALERVPGALGPSTLAQITAEGRALKALRFNGVEPTAAALANGSYRLYKSLLLVTGPHPSAQVRQFIAFVRSAQGRQTLQQNGHWVP